MRCPSCGLDNDPASEFCARCNAMLHVSPAASPESAAPRMEPAYPVTPARARPAWAWPLAAAAITAVIGATAIVVVIVLSDRQAPSAQAPPDAATGSATPPADATGPPPATEDSALRAANQAAELDEVLSASVASRRKLAAALGQVYECRGLAGATDDLRAVGVERQDQLAEVAALDLSALPDGERLRALLREALTHSLEADRRYVRWAEAAAANSCPNSGAKYRVAGDGASDSAGRSKSEFLAVWNALAPAYGLPTRTRDDI